MVIVEHALDLQAYSSKELGVSEWVTVTQRDIDDFARLSGDDNWIHVDVARAAKEMPGGKTIAHGLLVLSYVPALQRQIYQIRQRGRGFNYGYERIRFLSPVPVGSRVRLRQTMVGATRHEKGTRIEIDGTMELEGSERPAIVARNIILIENK